MSYGKSTVYTGFVRTENNYFWFKGILT